MKITDNWVNVSHSIGVPFGAIGTGYGVFGKFGFVLPNFDSTPYQGKYRAFRELPSYDYLKLHGEDNKSFMSLIFTVDGENYAFQGEAVDNTKAKTADKFTSYEFLPFAKHTAVYEALGTEVEMLTYTPLIPHQLSESAIPILCMEIVIRNNSDKSIEGELNFEFADEASPNQMKAVFADGNKVSLKSGEEKCLRAFFAWYYPDFVTPSAVLTENFIRYYTLRFKSAGEVIDYAIANSKSWKEQIIKWQDSINFPSEFKRMWFSSLS